MPSASELERVEQEAQDKPDPRNFEYELKKLGLEMAGMAERAALEIENLRQRNATLAAKAEAYDVVLSIIGLLPQQSQAYGEDFARRLRQRATELRENHG